MAEDTTTAFKMPLMAHLIELRKRVLRSLIVLSIIFCVIFSYSEYVFKVLVMPMSTDLVFKMTSPYVELAPREGAVAKLVFLAPAEAFWAHMKISMIASFIVGLPVIFFEIWGFIAPGLKPKERRYVLPFVITGTLLFVIGTAFCFYVILPFALGFLLTYKTESMTAMITVEKYMDFTLKFLLAFGLVFELPIVILFLTRMGIVSTDTLAKNRKYAVLAAFIIAAFLTPTPDAFNQTLMAVPMVVLYEGGILASRIFKARRDDGVKGAAS